MASFACTGSIVVAEKEGSHTGGVSIRGMLSNLVEMFTEDRELADCRLVLGNDSSLREKEREPIWKAI